MRNRQAKKSEASRRGMAITPLRIEISHEEILADLRYPARATRAQRGPR